LPRPQKCRRICREPDFTCFTPSGAEEGDQVILSLDYLRIIESFVILHGGSISAASEENKGTTFTIELPLAQKKTD